MKQRAVIFSPEARADLFNLYETLSIPAGRSIAFAYVEKLEAFCLKLDLASERGRARDDLRPGLRITGFRRRVTVAFSVDEDQVTILRLFYGGQDWERAFAE